MSRREYELNGPVIMSRDQNEDGRTDKGQRDETLAIAYPYEVPLESAQSMAGLSREIELERLQTQLPFVPIDPPVNHTILISALTDWVEVQIPSAAKMYRISYPHDEVVILSDVVQSLPTNGNRIIGAIANPASTWRYCLGKRSLYVRAGNAGIPISFEFFSQL